MDAQQSPRRITADRIAVLGDLSGWFNPLIDTLRELGAVLTLDGVPRLEHWPDDLAVIQVGDLVHKGPHSELTLGVVNDLLLPTGRWVQLAGNHEGQYLDGHARFWTPPLNGPFPKLIADWWADGKMNPAAAIDDAGLGPVLVTHGGLSPARWKDLDHGSADDVAAQLNAGRLDPYRIRPIAQPGLMLGQNDEPGVMWTEARRELRIPWKRWCEDQGRNLPFSQVHGHTSGLEFVHKRGYRVSADLADCTRIDERGHTVTELPGGVIVGVDPGATARRAVRPQPWMASGTITW